MPGDPPYFPNLPPHLARESLDLWQRINQPTPQLVTPVSNPVPPQDQPNRGSESTSVNADPLEVTWAVSGVSLRFTKDAQGYLLEENSVLGIVGRGRATCEKGHVQIDYVNSFMGRVTCTLALSGNVMQGSMNVGPISLPIYLQRT